MRWGLAVIGACLAVIFAPLLWLWLTVPIRTVDSAAPADAAVIFGALVRDGAISPLHAERLETGVALYRAGKAQVIVVSNAQRAATIMKDFLLEQDVPEARIEIDGAAVSTPDTCVSEAARAEPREILLVSQAYHLPRIALQCRRLGVSGQYVAAIRQTGEDGTSLWTKIRVRSLRHTREALLVWAELLGKYRELERTVPQ
ncbi:SanA/YdcF family protein [Mangrovicoccus algicola]|uniref:YdcF family protein n=1 Tax=Mangrovicoccus algicola TaxID=2771008 RepID=A0A8J7CI54_9RHOB|nr:YdcF family protein [Mangrovicoccus algicola]MBE3639165.1 YdcF family protein [Mangrovicoccus algicola]